MNTLQNFDYNGKLIQRRADGFVNLTQMCKANKKQINDFFRLKATKEYFDALELETGIPVNQLQQVIQGSSEFGGGSWGHPLVALRLAQWISPSFAVWCDAHIFNLLENGVTDLFVDQNTKPLIDVACFAIDCIFSNVEIKPELVAGLKLNAVQQSVPAIASQIEPSRNLLINSTAQGDRLLTPTDIGKAIGKSAVWVNKRLVELGFQSKNDNRKSKKESAYQPTDRGCEFADLTLASGSGSDGTTYQQLRWYESVVSQLI